MKKLTTMLMVGISAVMLQGSAIAQTDDPEMTDTASEAWMAADRALELCLSRCRELHACIPPHFRYPYSPGAFAAYRACVNRRNNCEVHCYRIFR
ncbi:hypothetical protein [Sorangium sp. So ce854]|uniref:hypothetical protein n=1 Tax=Sorangium sp. So ce854 TaxID=3133322 RepID=UPI003F62B877